MPTSKHSFLFAMLTVQKKHRTVMDLKCLWALCVRFKLEGDEHGWLDLNAESGELKTKAELDREVVDQLTVRIIAYETGGNEATEYC